MAQHLAAPWLKKRRVARSIALAQEERPPACPPGYSYLIKRHDDLASRRPAGEVVSSWSDILAYCQLTGWRPTEWELGVLSLLEDAHFEANRPPTPAPSAKQPGR